MKTKDAKLIIQALELIEEGRPGWQEAARMLEERFPDRFGLPDGAVGILDDPFFMNEDRHPVRRRR